MVVVNNGGGCWGGWGGWGWGSWCGPAFGFSVGFSFGYPFYASRYYPYYPYYPYYSYPYRYWPRYYSAYPYYGYPYYDYGNYCSYPSYLDDYPYVYREVEVPYYVSAPSVVEQPPPAVESALESAAPLEAPVPQDGEEALRPAQLSFISGLHAMQVGDYDRASESFFKASLEDPDSRLAKVFLATSLFSVGEYHYSAEYLRLGLENWEEFPSYDWDVRGLYGNVKDFEEHFATIERQAQLDPSDVDAQVVLGFVAMSSGQPEKGGGAFDAVRTLSNDPVELAIATRYLTELEDRSGAFPRSDDERFDLATREDPAVQAFLASNSPEDVPALPLR